jgi:y4mF family transcriptional regulator
MASHELPSSLSAFVRQHRKRLGYTQVAFADRAGVGLRFLRELERGKPTLRMDKVNEVLAFFGHELGPVPRPNPYREALNGNEDENPV